MHDVGKRCTTCPDTAFNDSRYEMREIVPDRPAPRVLTEEESAEGVLALRVD